MEDNARDSVEKMKNQVAALYAIYERYGKYAIEIGGLTKIYNTCTFICENI
jgi:hypothetical protein